MQLDLDRWYKTTDGETYAGDLFRAVAMQNVVALHVDPTVDYEGETIDREEFAWALGVASHRGISDAPCYAVDADIVTLIEAAAPTCPAFPFHASDVPSQRGFVWLERPIVAHDTTPERKPIVVRAFGWHTGEDAAGGDGMMLLLWTEPSDPRDHLYRDWVDEQGAYSRFSPHGLLSMLGGMWILNAAFADDDVWRLVATFLRFIGEPWLGETPTRPPRPAARRAQRAGRTDPHVTIIELRKRPTDRTEAPETAVSGSRRLTHRHPVSGHWRSQWYPSRGLHRPKYIWEYVKGPAGTPLVVNRKVYRVDR